MPGEGMADTALQAALETVLEASAAAEHGGGAGNAADDGASTAHPTLVSSLRTLRDCFATGDGPTLATSLVTSGLPPALVSIATTHREDRTADGGPRPGLIAAQALSNLAAAGRDGAAGVWACGDFGPGSGLALIAGTGNAAVLAGPVARAGRACLVAGVADAPAIASALIPPLIDALRRAWVVGEHTTCGDGGKSADAAAAEVAGLLGRVCCGGGGTAGGGLGAVLASLPPAAAASADAPPPPPPPSPSYQPSHALPAPREAALRLLGHWVAGGGDGGGGGGGGGGGESGGSDASSSFASALVSELQAVGAAGPAGEYEAALHLVRELAARPDGGAGLVGGGDGGHDAAAALIAAGAVPALLAALRRLGPPAVDRPAAAGARSLSNTAAPAAEDLATARTTRPALYPAERADTAAALANLLHRRPGAADAVVTDPAGPATILAQCQVERWGGGGGGGPATALPPPGAGPAFAREWALWAVRNLCEASPAAAASLAALTPVAGVDTPELAAAGLRVEVDVGTGKVRAVKRGEGGQ